MRVGMTAFGIPQSCSYSSHFQLPGTHSRSSKGEKCAAQMKTLGWELTVKTLPVPSSSTGEKYHHLFKILRVARICDGPHPSPSTHSHSVCRCPCHLLLHRQLLQLLQRCKGNETFAGVLLKNI